MDLKNNPPRTPWNNFPNVLIHADELLVKKHARYAAAESGSSVDAKLLVQATMSEAKNKQLFDLVQHLNPLLVSAHAMNGRALMQSQKFLLMQLGSS